MNAAPQAARLQRTSRAVRLGAGRIACDGNCWPFHGVLLIGRPRGCPKASIPRVMVAFRGKDCQRCGRREERNGGWAKRSGAGAERGQCAP